MKINYEEKENQNINFWLSYDFCISDC